MDKLQQLLEDIHSGKTNIQEGLDILKNFYSTDLGYAKIDHNREARVGYPEIIYGQGKTIEQISGIVDLMYERKTNILITRVNQEVYDVISKKYKEAKYNKPGRVITIRCKPTEETESYIAIVAAGTSDLPVVEEAFETATFFGNKIVKVTDVGVAGIHRLFDRIQILRQHSEEYFNNNVRINNILDNNRFTVKFRISSIVNFCNRNACIQYHFVIVEHLHNHHDDYKKYYNVFVHVLNF